MTAAAAARPGRSRPGRGRAARLAAGQAGLGPALALALVALLTAFVAAAGPRQRAGAEDRALAQVLAGLPASAASISVTSQWQAEPAAAGGITNSRLEHYGLTAFLRHFRAPLAAARGQSWTGAATPARTVLNPAPRAVLRFPPGLDVSWRSGLAAHSRLLAGTMPRTATATRRAVTLQAAATPAVAARFGLTPGSTVNLGPGAPGDPGVLLRITGIIVPRAPAALYWQANPLMLAPELEQQGNEWAGGILVGSSELTALQAAQPGLEFTGTWGIPLDLHGLTTGQLGTVLSQVTGLISGGAAARVAGQLGGLARTLPTTSTALADELTGYLAAAQASEAIESLLLTGLVVAGLLLVLACSALVAGAHEAELALVRARGGATRQVAARMLARTAVITVPAVAAGSLLAAVVTPAGGTAAAARLDVLTLAVTLAGPTAIAAWAHRRTRAQPGRADLAAARSSPRRIVAEVTFLIVAAGSLVALRQRGAATGADIYTDASPVLAAGVAALVVARLYPLAVRPLVAAGSATAGPVGFIGLARAARSRLAAIVPALVLVLSLSLAAFGAMVSHSVAAGQAATAWQQTGADAMIRAPGNNTISAAVMRRIRAVPGVQQVAPALVADPNSVFDATLPARGGPRRVGLVVADPASYAAVARGTPWPGFPPAALGGRLGPPGQPIPVLASAALGPVRAGQVLTLAVGGIRQPVRVAGTIGATPASPAGGPFVLLPSWSVSRFPELPWPQTLLLSGPAISAPALRTAVARQVPGGQLTLRAQVLRQLADSPVQHAAAGLYLLGVVVAILFGAVAIVLALAASARSRGQLVTRLNALGMASRQSRALALTEAGPQLLVGVAGMVLAGYVLAAVTGPALNLTVFTGSALPVPVRAWLPGMLLPAAVVIVVAAIIAAAENVVSGRRALAAELRQEEAR